MVILIGWLLAFVGTLAVVHAVCLRQHGVRLRWPAHTLLLLVIGTPVLLSLVDDWLPQYGLAPFEAPYRDLVVVLLLVLGFLAGVTIRPLRERMYTRDRVIDQAD